MHRVALKASRAVIGGIEKEFHCRGDCHGYRPVLHPPPMNKHNKTHEVEAWLDYSDKFIQITVIRYPKPRLQGMRG